MVLDNLYLEITRDCTIECEHCLRGNREHKNMSVITLENTLKNINKIDRLLLSGGEPLINIDLLEVLPELIKKYNIEVDTIGIITNGTIYSDRHVNALNMLKSVCNNFDFILSSDLFHRLEWKRLGVEKQVEENYNKYKHSVGIRKYMDDDRFHRVILYNHGRASTISKERLEELYKKYYISYVFSTDEQEQLLQNGFDIKGKLYINVDGYLVDYNLSFEEEDKISSSSFNVNIDRLIKITKSYIEKRKSLGTYPGNN